MLGAQSLPGFASLEARANVGNKEANRLLHCDADIMRQSPSLEQPLRSLVGHEVVARIKTSPLPTPCCPHAIDGDRFSNKAVSPGTLGVNSDCGNHDQLTDLHAGRTVSDQSTGRKKRRRLSSPLPPKHAKTQQSKVLREKNSRSNQAICFQHMEDFLACVLCWEAPKKQTPGNLTKSGLVGDKQQTMKALYILSEVLFRHTVSPLESKPGETPLQTVARETKCQIEVHLHDNSVAALPSCSLMTEEAPSVDRPCTGTHDREPCLLGTTSSCIKRRKQRRGTAFERNLEKLVAKHDRAWSTNSRPSIRQEERR